jgi:CheY-like chemotaxis protein
MNKLGEAKPDVIILDIMMPEESGLKFFHKLKKKEEYKDIPVIIVSGASQVTGVDLKSIIYNKDFRERKKKVFGIDAAPDAFLEKPVEPDTLMTTIREYLSS